MILPGIGKLHHLKSNKVQYALSCAKGGFVINRHNEIRNFTADILNEICTDVKVEPELQPLTGEIFINNSVISSDGARADVSARGFWRKGQVAFCDVRIFNPIAKSY